MITYFPPGSDIFASGAEALVSPVDLTGAQGAGLALEFAKRFPKPCQRYRETARGHGGTIPFDKPAIGKPWWAWHEGTLIVFCPTKRHYSKPSVIDDVKRGAEGVASLVLGEFHHSKRPLVSSIAIPALGSGLGGLAWDDVRPVLHVAAERMSIADVDVMIYEPHDRPRGASER